MQNRTGPIHSFKGSSVEILFPGSLFTLRCFWVFPVSSFFGESEQNECEVKYMAYQVMSGTPKTMYRIAPNIRYPLSDHF